LERVASRDGTQIAFDRTGEGSPVVLVGGALSDRRAAAALAALLARRLTVFAYDRRGRGDSGDTVPYAVDREVEDIAALVETAGGSASVYGHSSGAVLALEAADRGVAIAKLALYEPPLVVGDARPPLTAGYVQQLDGLVASGRRGDAVAFFLTAGVGLPEATVDQMRGAPTWPVMESLAHTLAYDGAVVGDRMSGAPPPARWGASVTMPVLVLDGGNSPVWQREAVRALAELLPKAARRTLDGQDHGADPRSLAPVLEAFFEA
jgi:pimeloyl-ACP methyl ester carboxylesterase